MADNSKIEWTDATWNPITGCSVTSPGCSNCYAMRLAGTRLQHHPSRAGLTTDSKAGPVWTGKVRLNEQWLDQPLHWSTPRRIFVCAHGDLFHESVPDDWIDRIFAVMALAPQHTFQVLTKRAERMRKYLTARNGMGNAAICRAINAIPSGIGNRHGALEMPLPNVWLGASAEDQRHANARLPDLLATPAALRFLSAEPLLGPIDLTRIGTLEVLRITLPNVVTKLDRETLPNTVSGMQIDTINGAHQRTVFFQTPDHMGGFSIHFPPRFPRLDWIIAGGESGPGARPMHPDWARSLRDQCQTAGVPFFLKQWGEWTPGENVTRQRGIVQTADWVDGRWFPGDENLASSDGHIDDEPTVYRIGKKAAGALLDGREWREMPR